MKPVQWLAVAFVTVVSIPLLAQQVDANSQGSASANASAAGAHAGSSTNTNANGGLGSEHGQASGAASESGSVSGPRGHRVSTSGSAAANGMEEMRPVNGELQGKLDSKTAKTGDPVLVKTTQKMTTSDGTEIPKGSRLVGHVTDVKAHGKGQAMSQLGITFDRAELKDGRNIPIHSAIRSISSPAAAMASAGADDAFADDMGPGPIGGGGRAVGGGGGALGGGRIGGAGMVDGTVNQVTPAGGNLGRELDSTAGNAMGETGRVAGRDTSTLTGDLRGSATGVGSLGAHATGVPGVMLSGDATGSAAGLLSATSKNVHLDSGTQLVLGVAAAH